MFDMNSERDLILMSLVIFIPSIFALLLLLVPKGKEEVMRWLTLIGTLLTVVVSLIIFVDYYADVYSFNINSKQEGKDWAGSLATRVAEAGKGQAAAQASAMSRSDWVARREWIPQFNIYYFVGLDGISLSLVLMTTILSALAMIASWNIERYVKGYCMLFLILETGMIGTFLALDFFLFYIFWEVMLLPMYFLIGVWGGPRREYAAIKFFLYTLLGSVFILISLLGFYFTDIRDFDPAAGATQEQHSFDLVTLQRVGAAAAAFQDGKGKSIEEVLKQYGTPESLKNVKDAKERLNQPFFKLNWQIIFFLLLFIGFAIKVPVFPFHTWLPDAHVEAPTPISMILAGVLLKLGGYGILRIAYPICPWAAYTLAWGICLFGIINIVYGAFAAMAQTDFKRLVAYSSISHMGYVILGIAVWSASGSSATGSQYWSWGMNGAMFQMIAHGITSAGMFFLVGVIYDRAHHRDLDRFRGLYEPMPLYGGISAVIFFAAMGLPGMCGFVGEFMVIIATWNYNKVFAILAALTVVLTAAYILWTVQRVYLGQNPAYKDFSDINLRELICAIPLVVFSVMFGVRPDWLLSWMEPSVSGLVDTLARVGLN